MSRNAIFIAWEEFLAGATTSDILYHSHPIVKSYVMQMSCIHSFIFLRYNVLLGLNAHKDCHIHVFRELKSLPAFLEYFMSYNDYTLDAIKCMD